VCGSAASLHFTGQTTTSVGASGAVFGVLGALLTSSFKYRTHLPAYNRGRLWTGLGIFLVYSLVRGFTEQGIDNAAHVGGLVGGAVLGLLLRAPFDDASSASQRHGRAGLGMLATAGAVGFAVLATPVPTTWIRESYAGQAMMLTVSNRFDSAFRRQAAEERRLQAGESTPAQYLQTVDDGVARPCRDIVAALAPLPIPLWDPTGHAAFVRLRGCQNFLELLRLQVARVRRDPAQPADPQIDAQLSRRLLEHAQMMRDMGFTNRRPFNPGPASAPAPTR
jgi:rhomboid protease GluP